MHTTTIDPLFPSEAKSSEASIAGPNAVLPVSSNLVKRSIIDCFEFFRDSDKISFPNWKI